MLDFPCADWTSALSLFFALVIGHAIADFPLQGEFLAVCKNRKLLKELNDPKRPVELWPYCLSAHSLINAGSVWLISGSALLAFIEFVLHWLIDLWRCNGGISFGVDQGLHVLCKLGYAIAGACLCSSAL